MTALGACSESEQEAKEDLAEQKYESQEDVLEEQADLAEAQGDEAKEEALDAQADALLQEILVANVSISEGDEDAAIAAFIAIARMLFEIPPFTPRKPPPENWTEILSVWLKGEPISSLPNCNDPATLQFIEDALIYRLPWGMEAGRVRALAHKTEIGDGLTIDDLEMGLAVPAIETGTLSVPTALLIKAGFSSRTAAMSVIEETKADFDTAGQLRAWLRREPITSLSQRGDWPTPETASLWAEFMSSFQAGRGNPWRSEVMNAKAIWHSDIPKAGQPVRILALDGRTVIMLPDYTEIGVCDSAIDGSATNLFSATVAKNRTELEITSMGPIPMSGSG